MTPQPSADDWGLIFDVDGVIANTEPLAMAATQAVFAAHNGARVEEADMLAFMGSTAQTYFNALSRKYAPDAAVAELIAEHNRILLRELRRARDLIFPGVRSLFVRASSDDRCRLALATGSGRARSEATIAAVTLPLDRVRAWITGDDIVHAKPHPEIYLKAAERLGLPPARCVAIEDSIAGVLSAQAAGMTCVAVTNTFGAEDLNQADLVLPTLEEATPETLRALV